MLNLKSVPFFKIISPYIFGIICAQRLEPFKGMHTVFLIIAAVWILSFFIQTFLKVNSYLKKGVYIFFTNLLLFSLAFESCYLYNARNNYNHYSNYVRSESQKFIVTVNDIPLVTQKFTKISVEVNSICASKNWHYAEGCTIIYLKNDSLTTYNLGQQLLVNAKFSFLNEPNNPFEFNYKTFLKNKNIFHLVRTTTGNVNVISHHNAWHTVAQLGTQIKSTLVSVLRNSSLSQKAFSICTALLVGYDDEIESDVMQSFSHSGTLHILSVSGMHTGVLYAILIFIFSLFDKYDRYKKIKFCFIVTFLLLFIFITGLSPSVMRAGLMLTLVLFGKTFYKQGNSYNTLLLSAFLLLLFNPYLLKDVGFLLSYFAVFGIMYFYPILSRLYVFDNKILQWLWTSVLISAAATLFTLPISLYYFHQFPIWFAVSNLIIIPISMMVMIGAAIFLVVHKIAFLHALIVYVINACTSLMLWLAQLTDNPQYGFIDSIPFSATDLSFLTLTIMLCLVVIATKQYKQVLFLCCSLILWLSLSIYHSYQQLRETELIVFHVKHRSVFALRVGQTLYAQFNNLSEKELQRYVKPYLLNISNLKMVEKRCDVLNVNGKEIVNAHCRGVLQADTKPQYIIVSNDTPLDLITNYKSKTVIIADCTNSYKFVKKLRKQCASAAITFYSAQETGAIKIKL